MGAYWNQGLFWKWQMPKERDPSSRDARGAAPGRTARGGGVRHLGWPGVACGATKEKPSLAFGSLLYVCEYLWLWAKHYPHFFLARYYHFLRCKREAFGCEGLMISKCISKEYCKLKSTPKHFLKPWVIRSWITLFLSARSLFSNIILYLLYITSWPWSNCASFTQTWRILVIRMSLTWCELHFLMLIKK